MMRIYAFSFQNPRIFQFYFCTLYISYQLYKSEVEMIFFELYMTHRTTHHADELLNLVISRTRHASCSCKIELPYYSVDHFPKICIYCGITGTTRTLGESVECYPKCIECKEKPDVNRRKRKSLVESDLKEEVNI